MKHIKLKGEYYIVSSSRYKDGVVVKSYSNAKKEMNNQIRISGDSSAGIAGFKVINPTVRKTKTGKNILIKFESTKGV